MAWCHRASFWHVVLYPLHFVISQAWIRSLPTRRWPPMAVTGRYRVSLEHSGHTNASSRCLSNDVAILLFALPDIQTLHVTRVGPKYLINDTHTHTQNASYTIMKQSNTKGYHAYVRVNKWCVGSFLKASGSSTTLKFLGLAVPDGGPANEKARSLNLRAVRAIRHAAGGTILRRDAIKCHTIRYCVFNVQ